LSIEDHFYQRMYSDIVSSSTNKKDDDKKMAKKKKKYKSYHTRLLEKSVYEDFRSRGKMNKYVDYNAFNSDEDSEDGDGDANVSLFQKYGLESRMLSEIATEAKRGKQKAPKWTNHVFQPKNNNNNKNNNNKLDLNKNTAVNTAKKDVIKEEELG
jgi:hypothetical protein